jgi:endoglucanase
LDNYGKMKRFGINKPDAPFFLPPYEWYYTPGTLSHADYTTPAMKNYRSSDAIMASVKKTNLNGFILLMHIGAGPGRADKFYNRLDELLTWLKQEKYTVAPLKQLLTY